MRLENFFRAAACAGVAIALVVACGSEDSSQFGEGNLDDGGASSSSSSGGSFNTDGSVVGEAGGGGSCVPRTCKDQGIECGPAGDGCGNLIPDCGTCGAGLRCGGPGSPSKCVDPKNGTGCTPKTCKDQNIGCGQAGDGCGLTIDCGACGTGKQCGNNTTPSQCVDIVPTNSDGGACQLLTKSDYTAKNMDCGPQSDGCGGTIQLGTCTGVGEFCGGGGPSKCGNPAGPCLKKTCADYVGKCGVQSDGCGTLTPDCGTCDLLEVCGGGGVASVCGGGSPLLPDGGACIPATGCPTGECGSRGDGCGGSINCSTNCPTGQLCGGAGVANQCGTPTCNKIDQATACSNKNCGTAADGCGGSYSCGTCTLPAICGGGGVPNKCGGGVVTADGGPGGGPCVKKDSTACTAGQCGPYPDGCGGSYNCGTAPNWGCVSPTFCGGGGTPGVCGGSNTCFPKNQAQACAVGDGATMNCGYAPDGCGGYVQCGTCPAGEACGLYFFNQCGSLKGPCQNANTTCTSNDQCCSGTCGALGKCTTGTCKDIGATCTANTGGNECCSGSCDGTGHCVSGNSGSCLAAGSSCTVGGTGANACCSGGCINGKCSLATSFCRQPNETCTANSECCGGVCSGLTGTTAGHCTLVNAPGGGLSCVVAGMVTGINGVTACGSTTDYACNSACCSGSCGPNDSTGGGTICQSPQGCAPLGELCYKDGDCCQELKLSDGGLIDLNGTSLTCSKPSSANGPTDPGRCNSATGCSKPGEICGKTGKNQGDFSCPFSNGCCEPPDFKQAGGGTNCQSDPQLCCKRDSLGIPRCVSSAICKQANEQCATSADCCDCGTSTKDSQTVATTVCADDGTGFKKCRPPAPGTNPPRCCVPDSTGPGTGICSVDGDCCNGNCFKNNPTDQTGVCKIPTCTKKTCADYPGKCGPQSDGCGDVIRNADGGPTDCGPCGVNQCCGCSGVPGQCGGTTCTKRTTCPNGFNCGDYPDGCGGTVHCGDCDTANGFTCGGGGQAYVCGKPNCNTISCQTQGIECGLAGNGCNGQQDCGDCSNKPGTTCGGCGNATCLGKCAAPACTAKTCEQLGADCGYIGDGCSGLADKVGPPAITDYCGDCPSGQTCGGGGQINKCGAAACTAKSCAVVLNPPAGSTVCGTASDGCNGTQNCGTCPMGQTCLNNLCVAATCTPLTCEQRQAQCGYISDGCGGLADKVGPPALTDYCGDCPAGQLCGADPSKPNTCGKNPCTPRSCSDLGAVCGQVNDGCGGLTPDCGMCSGTESCKNGACVTACTPLTCQQAGADCGYIADGCGGTVDCGVCPAGQECGYGGKANVCGQYIPK